jgi:hypothetical protein
MSVPFLHLEEWSALHPDFGTRVNCSARKGLGQKAYMDDGVRQFKTQGSA